MFKGIPIYYFKLALYAIALASLAFLATNLVTSIKDKHKKTEPKDELADWAKDFIHNAREGV